MVSNQIGNGVKNFNDIIGNREQGTCKYQYQREGQALQAGEIFHFYQFDRNFYRDTHPLNVEHALGSFHAIPEK